MKKHLRIFAMILLALTSGCSARVTTFPANSPSSFATPAPAVTLPPATPITQDLLIGKWKYIKSIATSTGENESQSLYGSAVKYGGTLNFDKDGMFGKYIGLQIFSGPYMISDATPSIYNLPATTKYKQLFMIHFIMNWYCHAKQKIMVMFMSILKKSVPCHCPMKRIIIRGWTLRWG